MANKQTSTRCSSLPFLLAVTALCCAARGDSPDMHGPAARVFHGELSGLKAMTDAQPKQVKLLAEEQASQDIDLEGMARWALNYLINNPRKALDYECRFNVFPLYCPPTVLGHDPVTVGDTDVRMDWEFLYMRDICGRQEGMDAQRGVRKRILSYVDDKGLSGFPYGKGEIGFEAFKKLPPDKDISFEVGGAKVPSFWSTAKTMVGLAETDLRTKDDGARALAAKMFTALKNLARWHNGRVFYDDKEIIGGNFVEAFVRYWELTKDPEALELALAFADGLMERSGIEPDGTHKGHSHSTMHMVWGVAHLGAVTGDPRYIEWARRVFDYMTRRGTDYGWFPAAFGDLEVQLFSETCATSDMVSIACCLAQAGYPHYWGHAERYVRNYIREVQFFITPEYEAQYHKLNPDNPEGVRKGIEMMKELEGGFLGTMAPNDQVTYVHTKHGGGDDYMLLWGCCSPEGMRTLHSVWSNVVTETAKGVFVNMHFNRTTPQARVVSFLPYTGRLTVAARKAGDFFLRPPSWALRDEVRAYRNGKPVEPVWSGPAHEYIRFVKATPDEELSITYPLIEFSQKMTTSEEPFQKQFTVNWLGDTVTGIEPKGPCVPMFTHVPRPLPTYQPLYQTR
jgi:hypothetical protein